MNVLTQVLVSGELDVGSNYAADIQSMLSTYGTKAAKEIFEQCGKSTMPILHSINTLGVRTFGSQIKMDMKQSYSVVIVIDMVDIGERGADGTHMENNIGSIFNN